MLERWYPWGWAPNVFAIDYAKLQALGYKGILFDIDNTLVHHGADATPKVEALFRELDAMGMKTLLLSDNSAERIQRINKVHHGLLAQKSALAGPFGEYPKIRGAYHVLRYQPDLL